MIKEFNPVEEKHKILPPAAFAIHKNVSEAIRDYFERTLGHTNFYFYEFFFAKPLSRGTPLDELLDRKDAVMAPFLSRILSQTGFIPALNEEELTKIKKPSDIQLEPLTPETFQKYWSQPEMLDCQIRDTDILQRLVRAWHAGKGDLNQPGYYTDQRKLPDIVEGIVFDSNLLGASYLAHAYPQEIIDSIQQNPEKAKVGLAKLREYQLVLFPWLKAKSTTQINILAVSISSPAVFWGECFVLYRNEGEVNPDWEKALREIIGKYVREIYVPTLTLLENYVREQEWSNALPGILPDGQGPLALSRRLLAELREVGEGRKTPSEINAKEEAAILPDNGNLFLCLFKYAVERPERWTEGLSVLERALAELWVHRLAVLPDMSDKVTESLLFAKYLVVSPAMVQRIMEVVGMRHMIETDNPAKPSSVKSALVVGGPGSGKDIMALLIRLFSPGFRFKPTQVFNMAMFRPKEAAVPILLGLEASIRTDLTGDGMALHTFTLAGLLARAIESAKPQGGGPGRACITLVFDELNSLDIDTQGALLRFLENAEVKPMAALNENTASFDVLVVGIMNEDPQMIMKRQVTERVLRERDIFGGLLGEWLYESFRNQRRLRDDLFYRLIRGGQVYLPELRNRREDIPVLLHFMISKEFRSILPKNTQWQVDLGLYEVVMDGGLEWQGNLRELQTVCRRMLVKAVREHTEAKPSPPKLFMIRARHAREALAEMLRPGDVSPR